MISKELQNKLKIQNNCVPIRDFLYFDKKYILTFKYKNRKIEFKYFEIENNKLNKNDATIEQICLHEAIHAVLTKLRFQCIKYRISFGTGMHIIDKLNNEYGRCLNECLT